MDIGSILESLQGGLSNTLPGLPAAVGISAVGSWHKCVIATIKEPAGQPDWRPFVISDKVI